MSINVVVLAGADVTYDDGDGEFPICVREIEGKALLHHVIDNVRDLQDPKFCFALLNKHVERYHLDDVVSQLVPDCSITLVHPEVSGALVSALMCACQLDQSIPLLIVSSNELINENIADVVRYFESVNAQAGAIVFESLHPRYSYVKVAPEGSVIEAAQHRPISRDATTGTFWFSSTRSFVKAATSTIRKNLKPNVIYYAAPSLNEIILAGGKVAIYRIKKEQYSPFKSKNNAVKEEPNV